MVKIAVKKKRLVSPRFASLVLCILGSIFSFVYLQAGADDSSLGTLIAWNNNNNTNYYFETTGVHLSNTTSVVEPLMHSSPGTTDEKVFSVVEPVQTHDFRVFRNVCLQSTSDLSATLLLRNNHDNATASDDTFEYEFWNGTHDLVYTIRVQQQQEGAESSKVLPHTTMIAPLHGLDNNFHLHNDFLMNVWWSKTAPGNDNVENILILKGDRKTAWKERLPVADLILSKLFSTVLYPLEEQLPLCFDRLILTHMYQPGVRINKPFYAHKGRFTERWHARLTSSYRDYMYKAFGVTATTTTTKPVLTYVARDDYRSVKNIQLWLDHLNVTFDVRMMVYPNQNTTVALFGTFLQSLHDTNILMGVHGAGLANLLYMRNDVPGNMLIEFIHTTNFQKSLFVNMCSKHDLPYYALDLRRYVSCRCSVPLPEDDFSNLTVSVVQSYVHEKQTSAVLLLNGKNDTTNNKCRFPVGSLPRGQLSPSSVSRCYLQKRKGKWKTCAHYGCTAYGEVE